MAVSRLLLGEFTEADVEVGGSDGGSEGGGEGGSECGGGEGGGGEGAPSVTNTVTP